MAQCQGIKILRKITVTGFSACLFFMALNHAAFAQTAADAELTSVQQKARETAKAIEAYQLSGEAAELALEFKNSNSESHKKATLKNSFYLSMTRSDLESMIQITQDYEALVGAAPQDEDKAIIELYKAFMQAYDPKNLSEKFTEKLNALDPYLTHENWSVAFQAYVLKCMTETHARNTFAALESAQTALAMIPNKLTIDARKARIQITDLIVYLHNLQNNTALAVENTQTLIELQREAGEPTNGTELLNNLMYSFGNWRDHDTRLFIAEILIKLEKETPSTTPGLTELRIAQVKSEVGEFDATENYARQAISKTSLKSIKTAANLQLAIAMAGQGRVRAARAILDDLDVKSKSGKTYTLYANGLLALAEGRDLEAIKIFNKRLDMSAQRILGLNNTDMTSLLASLENSRERQLERENSLRREAQLKAQKLAEQKKVNKLLWVLVGLLVLSLFGALLFARFRDKVSKELAVQTRLAKDADRMKTEFLGMISHELRTPLNGIIGIADFMASHNKDADVRQKSDIILHSGNTLFKLVEAIIDMSRIEGNKLELYPEANSLMQALKVVAEKWEKPAADKNIAYTYFISPDLDIHAAFDEQRVQQSLDTLLSNAIKFTEKGRVHLHITAEDTENDHITLKAIVADTGLGITEDVQAKLFRPFLQADSSMTRKHNGSGLNLAITRSLARMMGGDVSLISKAGRGSEFTLTLSLPYAQSVTELATLTAQEDTAPPLSPAPLSPVPLSPSIETRAASHSEGESQILDLMQLDESINHDGLHAPQQHLITDPNKPKSDPTDLTGIHVLIIDDNPSNQDVIKIMLAAKGVNCFAVSSGEDAITFLQTRPIDAIIMDVHMPGLDGKETTQLIRSEDGINKATPIVVLTADSAAQLNADCLEAGADIFLTKPVKRENLYDAIKYARQQALNEVA